MKLIDELEKITINSFNDEFNDLLDIEQHVTHEKGFIIVAYNAGEREKITKEQLYSETDWKIDGFSLGGIYTFDEFQEFIEEDLNTVIKKTELSHDDFPFGYFRFLILNTERRGNGAGFQLGLASYNYLARKVDTVGGIVWEYGNNKLVEIAEQFEPVERLYTFEEYEMFEAAENCPFCPDTQGECTCNFGLYVDFNAQDNHNIH